MIDLKGLVKAYKHWWGLDRVDRDQATNAAFWVVSVVVLGALMFFSVICLMVILRVMVRLI